MIPYITPKQLITIMSFLVAIETINFVVLEGKEKKFVILQSRVVPKLVKS